MLFLLVILLGVASVVTAQTWYDNDWQFRKKITLDATKVNGTQSNFPVLIDISDVGLQANAQADGDDILFADSDGVTKLDHEIELFASGTGRLVAWVRMPTIGSVSDTELFIYYGNNAAGNQQNATGVWDSNYKGVWHMTGAATTTLPESTSNPNPGTKLAAGEPANYASGKIAGAQDFDGSNDFVNCGSDASLDDIAIKTIEFWTNLDTWAPPAQQGSHFINKGDAGWFVATDITGAGRTIFGHNWTAIGRWSFPSFSLSNWHQIVVIYNRGSAANDPVVYVNGNSQAITEYMTPSGTALSDAASNFQMSKSPGNVREVNGRMDEVRISNIARSESWIKTSYNNMNSPSTFIKSIGDEIPLPVELSSFTAVLTVENYVTVKWVTQSETNVGGYYIYRSMDTNWTNAEAISSMIPSANSPIQQVYQYTDNELEEDGTYYYWLQVQDLDGTTISHGPTSVYFSSTGGGAVDTPPAPVAGINSIYPNPITPYSVISYTLTKSADVKFKVYNSRGQLVNSFNKGFLAANDYTTGWDGNDSNGNACPTGVYYIKLQAGKDSAIRKAVIVK
jgi:hypothetical protein